MAERRYTLTEIEKMRRYAEHIFLYGCDYYSDGIGFSRAFREADKEVAVEQRVRTMMAGGVDPETCVIKDRPPTAKAVR